MYEENSISESGKNLMSILVRFIGLFLLLFGLYVAIQVLLEAYNLYQKPEQIERFAIAIERGSNIDKSLVSFRKTAALDSEGSNVAKSNGPSNNIRVSYFFAWVIVLLLLLLIARISLSAIKTGGELVLYDMQIKQFARMLAKEAGKASN